MRALLRIFSVCLLPAFSAQDDPFKTGKAAYEAKEYAAAVQHLTKALEADPKNGAALDLRGSALFKLAKFEESLRDFDRFLELEPAAKNGHWRRGITCFYAGKFDEGRKQFEGYEKVDNNDVENAVWHFLCVARKEGLDKARAGLLQIGKDKRKPMTEVYELYAGKLKPEDVLRAASTPGGSKEKVNIQLFYANLYLGLYYDIQGDKSRALECLEEAVRHNVEHYM
jgi:lipoprotein NlpI